MMMVKIHLLGALIVMGQAEEDLKRVRKKTEKIFHEMIGEFEELQITVNNFSDENAEKKAETSAL